MKIQLTAALLLISSYVFAQPTTESEYKWIKNKMWEVYENGVDMKQGYKTEDIGKDAYKNGNGVLIAKKVIRTSDNSIAGTWIKVTVTGTWTGNGVTYYCVPNPHMNNGIESYGWVDFFTDLQKAGDTAKETLINWFSYNYSLNLYNNGRK